LQTIIFLNTLDLYGLQLNDGLMIACHSMDMFIIIIIEIKTLQRKTHLVCPTSKVGDIKHCIAVLHASVCPMSLA